MPNMSTLSPTAGPTGFVSEAAKRSTPPQTSPTPPTRDGLQIISARCTLPDYTVHEYHGAALVVLTGATLVAALFGSVIVAPILGAIGLGVALVEITEVAAGFVERKNRENPLAYLKMTGEAFYRGITFRFLEPEPEVRPGCISPVLAQYLGMDVPAHPALHRQDFQFEVGKFAKYRRPMTTLLLNKMANDHFAALERYGTEMVAMAPGSGQGQPNHDDAVTDC